MQMRKTAALALVLLALVSCKSKEKASSASTGTAATQTQTVTQTQPASSSTTSVAKTEVGSPMPEYTALNLDGSKFDLAAKRDKVVLLNVWATWCGPCRFEIPELQRLHEQYGARGLEVIGVSVDEGDPAGVRTFVADQKKMAYPIVLDPDGTIANLLQTSVLPTSIVVDRRGKIVWKRYGAIMEGDEELKKAVESAL
jgi:thiol-disulfide isomerase/thioredoxin